MEYVIITVFIPYRSTKQKVDRRFPKINNSPKSLLTLQTMRSEAEKKNSKLLDVPNVHHHARGKSKLSLHSRYRKCYCRIVIRRLN